MMGSAEKFADPNPAQRIAVATAPKRYALSPAPRIRESLPAQLHLLNVVDVSMGGLLFRVGLAHTRFPGHKALCREPGVWYYQAHR